jgi:hypothetical protein
MKAITQIITYLRDCGALTREQLLQLAGGGFLPWHEVVSEEEAEPTPPPPTAAPTLPADDYETPPERPRGKGRWQPKGAVLEPEEVGARLAERFGGWDEELEGLRRLAERLDAASGPWTEAAVVLRNADPDALAWAVAEGLAEGEPALDRLWRGLAVDDYQAALKDPGLHGTAVHAYRALLALTEFAPLGKYGSLLKVEEVAHVFNLKLAQRRVLHAIDRVLRGRPDLIAAGLRQDYHPLAYWSLVLLHTARRGEPGRRPAPDDDECHPRRLPADAWWRQAWAHAALMDPEAVPAFLIEHGTLPGQRPGALCAVCWGVLQPQEKGTVRALELYYRNGLTVEQIATALGCPAADVARELAAVRGALRRALEAHPLFAVPMRGEAAVSWDSFVEEWIRWHFSDRELFVPGYMPAEGVTYDDLGPELSWLMERYFRPTADLVCPKNWD